MRTTKAEVESVFRILVGELGGHVASCYNDVGGYSLDYSSMYGGYVIEQVSNANGGVRRPLGNTRLTAGEFVSACGFAIEALRLKGGKNA